MTGTAQQKKKKRKRQTGPGNRRHNAVCASSLPWSRFCVCVCVCVRSSSREIFALEKRHSGGKRIERFAEQRESQRSIFDLPPHAAWRVHIPSAHPAVRAPGGRLMSYMTECNQGAAVLRTQHAHPEACVMHDRTLRRLSGKTPDTDLPTPR